MLYGYETHKAQAPIYQAEGAESRLGEEFARNQEHAGETPSLFSRIRTWMRHLLTAQELAPVDSQPVTEKHAWSGQWFQQRRKATVSE